MEENRKKCSAKSHSEINAISYCEQCKKFMCNKCLNYHKEFFEDHRLINIENNLKEIFIDNCKENGHNYKLEFYCKNHNTLCCVGCISKLEEKNYGQHKNCDVCSIEKIKDEKKIKLNENIKLLEELSKNLEDMINELKIIFENISKDKEEIKLNVQKIFTKLRTSLNEREDELLAEIDNKYYSNFFNENIIKESNKLPNKVKKSLEIGKLLNQEWNNNNDKLSSKINDCINIENDINNIIDIKNNIEKSKSINKFKINFIFDDNDFNEYTKSIKSLGSISSNNLLEFKDSLILKTKEDLEKFQKLISQKLEINKIKLIYRKSRDGFGYDNIVNKIDNKSNLIFLYLTGDIRIFGNYIQTRLINIRSTQDHYYSDKNAFIFSLNNNKIYKVLKDEHAIRFYKNNDVIYSSNDSNSNGFYVNAYDNTINDNGLLKEPKIYDFERNNELTEGKNVINEIEIFQI